jgi:cbb3-type cytochrome oxidase maturation protein
MNALLILIPITLMLAAVAVGVFFWAVDHAQFEDLDTPKVLPLLDDVPENRAESRGRNQGSVESKDQRAPSGRRRE